MKITIESTTKIVTLNGIQCRIWEGATEGGIKVHCYIPRIATLEHEDRGQFENELEHCVPPTPEIEAIPLRMIL